MKKQQGFTLIELIIVIVLLSILSVVAIPKFLSFQDDANAAVVNGTGAAFRASVELANYKWRASGNNGQVNDLDVYGSGNNLIDINANGWPAQSTSTAEASIALNGTDDCISVWSALLNDGSPGVATDASQDYQVAYASNACTYFLVASPDYSITYNSLTGLVTIDDTI
ncbi:MULTISPECIES: type II secretion system protein [Alteromonadaceae]|jgi:prepilin-type N-terminal cleavage/methylation domain-containing protein|uniref:Type II secretion system protein n=1 Tax=Brumicola blandensis TaxID=3075611 RepID=A0AAW8R283_9ALTE|nr:MULTISPECIES: type II secretion system protein [unclassified Alteromonas]MDT0581263.1 type II secretion system protein [Alteromonas sp. W409]MDT0626880.1 type II secretion system protein [Alteromonas sp. W364]